MGVQGKVRDQMEKFIVLPFSMGCVSQASVAVAEQRPRRSKGDLQSPSIRIPEEEDDDESLKHSSKFLALPRPNLSTGVNRLVKGFKSLSQLFIYEDELDELGMEIEIGSPTDVKHVTHIGWDNIANTDSLLSWDKIITSELLSSQPTSTSFAGATPENDPATIITSLKLSTLNA